jgi:hypothetical protein
MKTPGCFVGTIDAVPSIGGQAGRRKCRNFFHARFSEIPMVRQADEAVRIVI